MGFVDQAVLVILRPICGRAVVEMSHKIAKLILENAETFLERSQAVEVALSLGMPLHEVEEYLDWLDAVGSRRRKRSDGEGPTSDGAQRPKAG